LSEDPIGFQSRDVNYYRYVSNNPLKYYDPLGLFTAIIFDCGSRNGSTYGGTVSIYGDNGSVVNVQGSIFPDNWGTGALRPGIESGIYSATYSSRGHRGRTSGIRVNNGGLVSVSGSNPEHSGLGFADGINIHVGDTNINRGSIGCITTNPAQGNPFSGLTEGETGIVIVSGCK